MLHDILVDLLPKVDLDVRRQLAEQLAAMPAPPPELLSLLAHDVPEVSTILLTHAALTDQDLLDILEGGNEVQWAKIAGRANLSLVVGRALVKAKLQKFAPPQDVAGRPVAVTERKAALKKGDSAPAITPAPASAPMTSPATLLAAAGDAVLPTEIPNKNPVRNSDKTPAFTGPSKVEMPKVKIPGNEASAVSRSPVLAKAPDPSSDSGSADGPPEISSTFEKGGKAGRSANRPPSQNDILAARAKSIAAETRILQDISRSSIDWTWETDRQGLITFLSDPSLRAFGQPGRMLIGADLGDYCQLAAKEAEPVNLKNLLARRRPFRDVEIITRDGKGQPLYWILSGVPGFEIESGRFTGFRGAAYELKMVSHMAAAAGEPDPKPHHTHGSPQSSAPAATEVVISSGARNIDKNTAEVIQNLSHELRTPLNAILGFSEMIDLETLGPVSETYHEKTRVILHSAHNLKNVITDVLDVAKLRAGRQHVKPKFFSLSAVLKLCFEAVGKDAETQHITLDPPRLPRDIPLLNDPAYVERCLVKIMTYVIYRAYPGESFWLDARPAPDRKVDIDLPLLGAALSLDKLLEEHGNLAVSGGAGATTFTLSVAADLAEIIGGQIKLMADEARGPFLRLTLGDFPVIVPLNLISEDEKDDNLEDLFANEA